MTLNRMGAFALAGLIAVASGCLSAAPMQAARTIAPGKVSHVAGIGGFVADDRGEAVIFPLPIPFYSIRVGLAESYDLGLFTSVAGQGRADLRVGLLSSELVALAVAPAIWVHAFPSRDSDVIGGGDVPVVFELSDGEYLSVVPWIGPGLAMGGTRPVPFLRWGLGFRVRLNEHARFQLEVSSVIDPDTGSVPDATMGIGVGFGAAPGLRDESR